MTVTLAEDTAVAQDDRTAARVVDGRAVVIVIDERKLHTLNDVGTRIWQLADGRTIGEIAECLTREFDVTREKAVADTCRFVGELHAVGALRVGSGR